LTHKYGKEGRDLRKFENKCLVFDMDFFKSLTTQEFIQAYNLKLKEFIDLINENQHAGNFLNIRIL
jgi:hypothetical protein